NIYDNLKDNLEYLKIKYNVLINSDIVIREFTLTANDKEYKSFLIYIDGMIDSKMINDFVLKPLMLRNFSNTFVKENTKTVTISKNLKICKIKRTKIDDYIYNSLIPQNTITKETQFSKIISDINSGNCALFIDTVSSAFNIEVKGFKARAVSEPNNEIVVHGSQEAFVENIRTNTSLLRRIVNNENLVIESTSVGTITRTKVAICYMKNIANDELVSEVKYRINNLGIDSLVSSGQLDQLIQDNSKIADPQIISTERPDKAANHLLEGRVVVIVNGSPYVLIMPGLFMDFLSSPEDMNLKHQFANLLKAIRLIAAFFALLLPGIYIAITNYHQELIPTELLFAISASRQTVPFPVFFEIILMEVSFELIREAGLRVPSPMGATIGIVGALILGEAAVNANIVSPILIIIVAITGICSFAIPDFSLSFSLRLWRFFYILAGYLLGFLGIGFGLFVNFALLLSLNSFGVPYFSPYAPVSNSNDESSLFLLPIWKRDKRADFLNTKRIKSQEKISRKWRNSLN
ncbi:MAG: spore germination protein, partial [Clostridia bacterium]|nr:spore germination protein [Clostridia bacterium]